MAKLVFVPPDMNEPGHLRRLRKVSELLSGVDRLDLEAQDELIEYLLQWVKEPKDQEEARELLLDLSKMEFRSIVVRLLQGDKSPLAETSE